LYLYIIVYISLHTIAIIHYPLSIIHYPLSSISYHEAPASNIMIIIQHLNLVGFTQDLRNSVVNKWGQGMVL
ncbi:hypothetical protein Q7I53_23330, partial [Escherichia coli]|uniref:hypothetical protein n=1 Tax=Escherichia coli TaxID=562 RepID=UPI003EE5BCF0